MEAYIQAISTGEGITRLGEGEMECDLKSLGSVKAGRVQQTIDSSDCSSLNWLPTTDSTVTKPQHRLCWRDGLEGVHAAVRCNADSDAGCVDFAAKTDSF